MSYSAGTQSYTTKNPKSNLFLGIAPGADFQRLQSELIIIVLPNLSTYRHMYRAYLIHSLRV